MAAIMNLRPIYQQLWEASNMADNPVIRGTLILKAPDITNYTNVVVNTLQFAIETFLTDYAETEDSLNDVWYYNHLKEQLYDAEGYPNLQAFIFEAEGRQFQSDPLRWFEVYFETVASLFEEIIEANKEEIERLYLNTNLQELNVNVHNNFLVVSYKGKQT